MDAFPAYYPLAGKTVVIAGEGDPAEAKARLFEGSPARLVRLAGAAALSGENYHGADLIFVASWDSSFRRDAHAAARSAGVPVNVMDEPGLSDFHTPAIIDRGALVAAIGTGGAAPLIAAQLRAELESRISEGVGTLAGLLGAARDAVRVRFPDLTQRRAFLRSVLQGPIADLAARNPEGARAALAEAIARGLEAVGSVETIALPPEIDLLTLRQARALAAADVLVFDPLNAKAAAVAQSLGRRDAERVSDETSEAACAALAAEGRRVVRLI
jgi:precorrin-2 dehydrogenase / sirohydrochlorin ferrochelatase